MLWASFLSSFYFRNCKPKLLQKYTWARDMAKKIIHVSFSLQYIKVGTDNKFVFLWSFPEYWRVLKTTLLLDLEFLKGCWYIGVFCFESPVWVPIVRFGEVLSSLLPVESCGDSICTALLKMAREGSWIESHCSDAVLLLRLLPGCSSGTVNSFQTAPVWCDAEPLCCTLMKPNIGVQYLASLLCLQGIPLEECPALRKIPQMRHGSLTVRK